jgi:hypothetical protein
VIFLPLGGRGMGQRWGVYGDMDCRLLYRVYDVAND